MKRQVQKGGRQESDSGRKRMKSSSPVPVYQRTQQSMAFDTINEAIHEFLLKSGFLKTVDIFQVNISSFPQSSFQCRTNWRRDL
jgi:hypothetical protein